MNLPNFRQRTSLRIRNESAIHKPNFLIKWHSTVENPHTPRRTSCDMMMDLDLNNDCHCCRLLSRINAIRVVAVASSSVTVTVTKRTIAKPLDAHPFEFGSKDGEVAKPDQ